MYEAIATTSLALVLAVERKCYSEAMNRNRKSAIEAD
jgi:hypothetical protein